jgi:uncharacterized LabA/DUF88 family protein
MNLQELKRQHIRTTLGISVEQFPRILVFIDFANVDHWFDDDQYDLDGKALPADQRIAIDLQKLKEFLDCFSIDARFYYGHDPANSGSMSFNRVAKYIFGKHRVFTKRIQQVRHNLTPVDSVSNTRLVHSDDHGNFVLIPKCNFDVEISVDAIRSLDKYDTFCLLSGDSDFAVLLQYLKRKGKRVIVIASGKVYHSLKEQADLYINAQQIKRDIATIKEQKT